MNKKRLKKNLPPIIPLYTGNDVEPALRLFEAVDFEKEFEVRPASPLISATNGHILGSGSVFLRIQTPKGECRIGFTGDIGRPNRPS
jgi:metallo-beta-lactamase family protein